METKVTHVAPKKQYGRHAAAIGALLVIIGAFLPWGAVDNVVTTGLSGDGIITLILAVVVLFSVFIKRISLWFSLALGALIAVIGVAQTFSITQKIDEIKSIFASSLIGTSVNGRIGVGVYLTILGAAFILFGTFIQWIKNRRTR